MGGSLLQTELHSDADAVLTTPGFPPSRKRARNSISLISVPPKVPGPGRICLQEAASFKHAPLVQLCEDTLEEKPGHFRGEEPEMSDAVSPTKTQPRLAELSQRLWDGSCSGSCWKSRPHARFSREVIFSSGDYFQRLALWHRCLQNMQSWFLLSDEEGWFHLRPLTLHH